MSKRSVLFVLPLVLLGLLTVLVSDFAVKRSQIASDKTAAERLTLYRQTILGVYEKYRYLPYMIARDPRASAVLDEPSEGATANRFLEEMARNSRADLLFMMDRNGDTVAASNWQTDLSLIGRNYGFRPYFQSALKGAEGQYFAVGMTTGRPGLFLARPTPVEGEPKGVAVVKVDTRILERAWREGGETVFATDRNGIVFLSAVSDWKYKTTQELAPAILDELSATRQYADEAIQSLSSAPQTDTKTIQIDGQLYRHNSAHVGLLGWKLHFLVPQENVRGSLVLIWSTSFGLALLYVVGVLVFRGRALRRASAQLRLESAELKELNSRLTEEVEERRRIERELIRTQEGLARSSRLAAVGQMSSAVAHELNQPLAALRMFIAGTRKFLENGNLAAVTQNLNDIDGLQDRMANLTQELKRFARPTESKIERVDLRECIRDSIKIARPRFDETDVGLKVELPDVPLVLDTARYRIEQVLLNLLKNAADAAALAHEETGAGEVVLQATRLDTNVLVSVADNGQGVSADIREKIFDPYFTTKMSSGGLGLGLSISMRIAEDLGGTLTVNKSRLGGAAFILTLPGHLDAPETAFKSKTEKDRQEEPAE